MLYLCTVKIKNAMFGKNETYVIAEYGAALRGQSRDVMYLTLFSNGCYSLGHDLSKAVVYTSYHAAMCAMFELYEMIVTTMGENLREHYRKALHIEKLT